MWGASNENIRTQMQQDTEDLLNLNQDLDTSYFFESFSWVEEIMNYLIFSMKEEFQSGRLNKDQLKIDLEALLKEMGEAKYKNEVYALIDWDEDYNGRYKEDIYNEFKWKYLKVVENCYRRSNEQELSDKPKDLLGKIRKSLYLIIK